MFVWSKIVSEPLTQDTWCKDNKGFFHGVISFYTNGIKPREDSHRGHRQAFICDRNAHTNTQSIPKLLCVGETGLGDRFGELVSML